MTVLLQALTKRFGERLLFTDLNAKLDPGRSTGICGRNGSGKSTLLKIVAGLEPPTAGSVVIRNGACRPLQPRDALYFPQRHEALELTGLEFWRTLATVLGRRRVTAAAGEEWASAAPARIQDLLRSPIERLSLGQQRAVLFYAFAIQPRTVMLFDEPFAGLSSASVDTIVELFALLDDRHVLIVDHRRSVLESLCNDIIEL